ncbi:MAG: hypothetical protein IKU29_01600 [Parabacteroides sp.]|nr:hypothetical protein [Parabacteroides sp.]
MTNKFHIKNENGYWYVNDNVLQVPTTHIDGYAFSLGKEGRLNISQGEENDEFTRRIDIRVFQNGRFTSKIFVNSAETGYLKKYVETPIDGYVFISKNEKGVYAYYRESDLQSMMDSLGVESIKSKPSKSFFINKDKWKIYDGMLSGKMLNSESFISVVSSGIIKKHKNDSYIYIDFTNVDVEKRYVIVKKQNKEGNNNFASSVLYVDNQMLTKDLYDEIKKKEYYWYIGSAPEKARDERNKQIKKNYKQFIHGKAIENSELDMSSKQLNVLETILSKLKRNK